VSAAKRRETGGASAPPASRSLFTEAYLDEHECAYVHDHGLAGQVRRARLVAVAEGTGPYEQQGYVTVQWLDRHDVSRIKAQDFTSPRYSIQVVHTWESTGLDTIDDVLCSTRRCLRCDAHEAKPYGVKRAVWKRVTS
jgi:hypothetical protein